MNMHKKNVTYLFILLAWVMKINKNELNKIKYNTLIKKNTKMNITIKMN
jgi:hypothetical protein